MVSDKTEPTGSAETMGPEQEPALTHARSPNAGSLFASS